MGFVRRLVRKSVRRVTPKPVRQVAHPVRTAKNAVVPRQLHQVSRAGYVIRHPIGAAENNAIDTMLLRGHGRGRSSGGNIGPDRSVSPASVFEPTTARVPGPSIFGIMLAVAFLGIGLIYMLMNGSAEVVQPFLLAAGIFALVAVIWVVQWAGARDEASGPGRAKDRS